MQLNTYLNFNGNCREAFAFYEKALGAKSEGVMTWGDAPVETDIPASQKNKVMHGSINLKGNIIMGADVPPDQSSPGMNGFHVAINLEDPAEAERFFKALSEGGKITMPLGETFWAQRFGMLTDRFGVPWMINCQKPQ